MQLQPFVRGLFVPMCLGVGVACASAPEKPDPLAVLASDDEERRNLEAAADVDSGDDAATSFPTGTATRPEQISGPSPSLPPAAIVDRVTGVWIARCTITEMGTVERCKILKGLPHSNAHLLHIFRAQKYTPVMFEGKPQRVRYTFKVTFK